MGGVGRSLSAQTMKYFCGVFPEVPRPSAGNFGRCVFIAPRRPAKFGHEYESFFPQASRAPGGSIDRPARGI